MSSPLVNNRFEWNLNSDITIETARTLIEAQCFHVHTIKPFGIGFDNLAFLINENFVFRFPRHKAADEYQLKNEIPVLQHLIQLIITQIPNPLYIGTPTKQYPFHFQGYKKIEGVAACDIELTESELKTCLQKLAQFLKQLHSISATQANSWGLEKSQYDQTNIDQILETLNPRIASIVNGNIYNLDMSFIEHEIKLARNIQIPHNADCLIHSDLHMKHIIINNKQLTGIIDWGDVTIGHPLIDFAILHELFPTSMHHLFFKIYGIVDAGHWHYARFLALKSILTTMLYAHDIKDKALFTSSIEAYKKLQNK